MAIGLYFQLVFYAFEVTNMLNVYLPQHKEQTYTRNENSGGFCPFSGDPKSFWDLQKMAKKRIQW